MQTPRFIPNYETRTACGARLSRAAACGVGECERRFCRAPSGSSRCGSGDLRSVRLAARIIACLVLVTLAAGDAPAQSFNNFNSGSTGTVDMIITSNTTIALPSEGILHYRNITINNGATLTFSNNALNTPVYLLAQSNVLINGTLDVSGKPGSGFVPGQGGPGGFVGGFGANGSGVLSTPGEGKGPGGGKGFFGQGGCAPTGNHGRHSYGNVLCSPLLGGSGGAGGPNFASGASGGGGGGGGAILIAANGWITNNGSIQSLGGIGSDAFCNDGGAGSGGAIRLVAPLVSGTGVLNVGGNGGPGRMRIDSTNTSAANTLQMLLATTAASATRGAQGFVFPQDNRLTITNVTAGSNTYSLNPSTPASISLPAGPAITNAIVEVRAEGQFYGATTVPIAVVVTPENGASATYTNSISISNNAGSTNVTVTIPTGTTSTLHVWTR